MQTAGILLCVLETVPSYGLFEACRLPLIQLSQQAPPTAPGSQRHRTYLLRKFEVDGQVYHEELQIRDFDAGDYVTSVMRRHVRKGEPSKVTAEGRHVDLPDLRPAADVEAEILRLIDPLKEQNIKQYEERQGKRKKAKWDEGFIDFLRAQFPKHVNNSIYVSVTPKGKTQPVGGARYILAPYGIRDGKVVAEGELVERYYGPVHEFATAEKKYSDEGLPLPPRTLPEEDALRIEVDHPAVEMMDDGFGQPSIKGGLNIEMGALFVDKSLPPEEQQFVNSEIWLQTLRLAHHSLNDELNFYGTTIHAYADVASKKLYLPMGFELLRTYRVNGETVIHRGPDESVPHVTKPDGSHWWPIVYRPEKISQFVRDLRDGKIPRRRGDQIPERLLGIADHRDGEPIALSTNRMEDVVDAIAADEGWEGAGYSLNRMVETYALHKGKAKTSEDAMVRERAERSAKMVEGELRKLPALIPKLLSHPDPYRRMGLTGFARNLIHTAGERDFLPPSEVMDSTLIPLLADEDLMVQLHAIHEVRNVADSVPKLRAILGVKEKDAESFEKEVKQLEAMGAWREQLYPIFANVRALVTSPVMRHIRGDVYQQNSAPVNRLLGDLMPYAAQRPEFFGHLLRAAVLEPVPDPAPIPEPGVYARKFE